MAVHVRVAMFLRERDRARARGDWGVDRSLTADLRRLGVPDDATTTHPSGLPRQVATAVAEPSSESIDESPASREQDEEHENEKKRGAGRPKLPRCEHGQIATRCHECNEELLEPSYQAGEAR